MCFVNQDSLNCSLQSKPCCKQSPPELSWKFSQLNCNSAIHNGNLSQYLIDKCEKHSLNLELVKNDYAAIIANYEISNRDGMLFSKVDNLFNSSISLTNKTLMKVIYKSNIVFSKIYNLDPNAVHEFNITHQNENWKIGAFRNEEGKLTIFKFEGTEISKENPNFLGEGNYGIVQRISDFSNAQFLALKTAKSNERKKINSIITEVRMLKQNSGLGLQRGVNGLLTFKDGILGCTTQFYNKRSLFNGIDELLESITSVELLQLIIILLSAIKTLHSEEIIHGDIKPANCLLSILELNNKLFYELVLGDLGGAVLKKKLLKSSCFIGTPHTGGYFTLTDIKTLKRTHQNNKIEWIEFCKKRDLFAITQTIWFMLTKAKPYQTKEFQFMDGKTKTIASTEVLYNIDVVEGKIGENATRILIRALDEDPSERPSIDEMLKVLNHAIDFQNKTSDSIDLLESESEEGTFELSDTSSES